MNTIRPAGQDAAEKQGCSARHGSLEWFRESLRRSLPLIDGRTKSVQVAGVPAADGGAR